MERTIEQNFNYGERFNSRQDQVSAYGQVLLQAASWGGRDYERCDINLYGEDDFMLVFHPAHSGITRPFVMGAIYNSETKTFSMHS